MISYRSLPTRLRLLLFAVLLLSGSSLLGQPSAVPSFQMPLGPTNAGRDFWLSFPANWEVPSAAVKYIRLYITAADSTWVTISVGGVVVTTVQTIPFGIVTADLTPTQGQIFTRKDTDPIPNDTVYVNQAIHVSADIPIVLYGMNRTSFTSDGFLALPEGALSTEYVVSSYAAVIGGTQELPSQFMVIAPSDSTIVTITQSMASPNHTAGEIISVRLDRGDVYSGMSKGVNGDMSGTTINATKPVAVTAGQSCAYIPNVITYCCCDHLAEEMLPVSSWGKLYHAAPIIGRRKGDIYRIFAAQESTAIFIDGVAYGTLQGPGGVQGERWLEYRATGQYVVEISADKPINVAQYNTSSNYDGIQSDPFYMVLSPVEQYQTEVIFTTPSADFPLNYVNLVCDSAAWYEMEIAPGGTNKWQMLRTFPGAGNPPRFFPSKVNGLKWLGVTLDIAPGTYRLRSPRPFAGYIYGFSSFDSYGYPLAGATRTTGTLDKDPPVMTISTGCDQIYGQVNDGAEGTPTSGISMVAFVSDGANNVRVEMPAGFVAGLSSQTTFVLDPYDPVRGFHGTVVAIDMGGLRTEERIDFDPINLEPSARGVDFGTVPISTNVRRSLTVQNHSPAPAVLSDLFLRSGKEFVVISPLGSTTIPPSGSITVELEFAPTAVGLFIDTLMIKESCGDRFIAELRGIGPGPSSVPDETRGIVSISAHVVPATISDDHATLRLELPTGATVRATLYDAAGHEVRRIVDSKWLEAGIATERFDVVGLPTGIYNVIVIANGEQAVCRISVVR